MFWFRHPIAVCASLTLATISCVNPEKVDNVKMGHERITPYFELEAYFSEEAIRLQRLAPTVAKTVSKDGETENKAVKVSNWENELALFIESDINKPAWRTSYQIDSLDSLITYTCIEPELRTRKVSIEKQKDGSVKHITVTNRVTNMLYRTEESLDYYPDSLYRISKYQQVRVIGESRYAVTGLFN